MTQPSREDPERDALEKALISEREMRLKAWEDLATAIRERDEALAEVKRLAEWEKALREALEAWTDADKGYGSPYGDTPSSREASRMALSRAQHERATKARNLTLAALSGKGKP